MKRKTIKKLGIIIMSAMIAASPVATPFTTMTVYAVDCVDNNGEIETNTAAINENNGTIGTNEGTVESNYGTITTNNGTVVWNENGGTITTNEVTVEKNNTYGTIATNNGTVGINYGTITTNEDTVTKNSNNGTITTNNGTVVENYQTIITNNDTVNKNHTAGTIDTNNGTVAVNYGTIGINEGTVGTNFSSSTIENNYGTVTNNYGTVNKTYIGYDGSGSVSGNAALETFFEVLNAISGAGITVNGGNVAKEVNDRYYGSGDISFTISSDKKIIDVACDVKNGENDFTITHNEDGTWTITGSLSNPIKITGTFEQVIAVVKDKKEKTDTTITVVDETAINPALLPVNQTFVDTSAGVTAGIANLTAVSVENAVQVAKALENDPVVNEIAQQMTTVVNDTIAQQKASVVNELNAAPNQSVEDSAEYVAKQAQVEAVLYNQLALMNNITIQQLAAAQKAGMAIEVGGCQKLDATNVQALEMILAKGIPVTITFANANGAVTLRIPSGTDLTRYLDANGKLDLKKLMRFAVRI